MNDFNYAGFGWRVLAHFIDFIIINSCIILGLGFLMGIVLALSNPPTLLDDDTCTFALELAALLLQWLYYALMESSPNQATLGKKLCKLKVTDTDGHRISFLRATGRYAGKFLSALACIAGYVMAAFTARKQALHDRMAKTLVLQQVE